MGRSVDVSYRRYRQYRSNVYQYKLDQITVPIVMMFLIHIFTEYWWLILTVSVVFFSYCVLKKEKNREEKDKQLADKFQQISEEKSYVEIKKEDCTKEGEFTMKKHVDKQMVYDYLTTIPKGKVVTYGRIAEYIGNKNLARTVGNILHDNPDGEKYPCYKVVNSKGMLSERYLFGGIDVQREKLEADGIVVEGNKVDLDMYGW